MADTNAEFQVISNAGTEDACIEAQTSGPRDVALREAMHYAEQYAEDGPVSVFEHIEVARLGYPSGNYGPTATPPADAALADDAIIELVTDYAQSKVRAESCRYHYESKEYDKEAADTLEQIRAALRARAVPGVPLSALVCVGRARFPRTGGNAGIAWHVEDALSDTGGFRSGSPCNGELLFVLPTTAKRAMLAASKSGDGGAG